jgi:hypothetical protein
MAARFGLHLSALPSARSARVERLLAVALGLVLVHLMDMAGWQLGSVAAILLAVALCPTSPSLRAS